MLLAMVDVSFALLFVVTFLALYVVYRSRSNRRYPPSLPWLPVVGSLPFMGTFQRFPMMFMQKAVTLGNIFSFYAAFNKYVLVINGREAIHDALVTRSTDFADRDMPFFLKHINHQKSPGLIWRSYGPEFKRYRKLSLNILKEFGFGRRIMEKRISVEVLNLVKLIKQEKGEAFDYQNILTASVANVIYAILFGSRQDTNNPELLDLTRAINRDFQNVVPIFSFLPMLRFLPPFKGWFARSLTCAKERQEVIGSCIKKALESETTVESFVSGFIRNGGDDVELTGIITDLIMAGSETSTTQLRWSLVALANHPDVQERLHKEIDAVVPKDRFPTLDDKPNMPYVEASLVELMRWRTLTPFTVTHKTMCDTEVGGYFIPKETQVIVNLYSAHMDPRVWKDPNTFCPERFLEGDGNITDKNLIIPFSLGKRSCLGEQLARQELFLFYTGLLQHFEIRPPEGQEFIDDTENLRITLFPSPFKVRLIPRNLAE